MNHKDPLDVEEAKKAFKMRHIPFKNTIPRGEDAKYK